MSTYTVLGGDLPAGVLHGGRDGVGHGVGGISQELSISIGLGLRLSLSVGSVGSGGVTDHVHHVLAERLVLDLLSLHHLGLADVLGPGRAGLGDEDLVAGDTVGGRHSQRPGEPKLRVGLGLCCGGGQAGGDDETESEVLQC